MAALSTPFRRHLVSHEKGRGRFLERGGTRSRVALGPDVGEVGGTGRKGGSSSTLEEEEWTRVASMVRLRGAERVLKSFIDVDNMRDVLMRGLVGGGEKGGRLERDEEKDATVVAVRLFRDVHESEVGTTVLTSSFVEQVCYVLIGKRRADVAYDILASGTEVREECAARVVAALVEGAKPKRALVERAISLFVSVRKRNCDTSRRSVELYEAGVAAYAARGAFGEALVLLTEMAARCGVSPKRETFHALLAHAKRGKGRKGGDTLDVWQFLREMAEAGVSPDSATFSLLVRYLAGVGAFSNAETIRERARRAGCDLNLEGWTSLIDGYARRGHPQRALEVVAELAGAGLEASDTVNGVALCCRCLVQGGGEVEDIVEKVASLGRRGLSRFSHLMQHRMTVACLHGELATAFLVYSYVCRLRLPLNSSSLQLLAQSTAMQGEPSEALGLMAEMEEKFGHTPSLKSYTAVIACLLQLRGCEGFVHERLQQAEALWLEAYEVVAEKKHDLTFYNVGIHVCGKLGQCERAEDIVRKLRANGLKPDAVTYHSLIGAFMRSGMVAKLGTVLPMMSKDGQRPTTLTYTLLVAAYSRLGALPAAFDMVGKARHAGCKLGVRGWTSLVDGHCRLGDVAGGERVVEVMRQNGLAPTRQTFGALMKGDIIDGRVKGAHARLEEMQRVGVSPSTAEWNILLKGYSDAEMEEEVWETLMEMRSAGYECDHVTFSTVMRAFSKGKHPNRVRTLFRIAEKEGIAPDAAMYTNLMAAYAYRGRTIDALHTFDEALGNPNVVVDVPLLNLGLRTNVRSGKTEEAERLYRRMTEQLHLTPTLGTMEPMLRARVHRDGDVEGVLSLLRDCRKYAVVPTIQMFDPVVDTLLKRRRLQDLSQVMHAMKEDFGLNVEVYEEVLRGHLLVDETGKAAYDGSGFEQLKFWVGLPNNYYQSRNNEEWKWWDNA